jgi:UDP-N-acetylglucosamine 2-epimerase (non-hydrolysing)
MLTDKIADLLFTRKRSENENLRCEGVAEEERILFAGDVVIGTLPRHRERALALGVVADCWLEAQAHASLTFHRPLIVDVSEVLSGTLDAVEEIQGRLPILFPAHPRAAERISDVGPEARVAALPGLRVTEPLGNLGVLDRTSNSLLVMTDSGGAHEETTTMGGPCLRLRKSAERPATVMDRTNMALGSDPQRTAAETLEAVDGNSQAGRVSGLRDGRAAERAVEALHRYSGPFCSGSLLGCGVERYALRVTETVQGIP